MAQEPVNAMYDALYATLKRCGVDGVKADAQSGVGALGGGRGGGPYATSLFVGAMERAGRTYFRDEASGAVAVSNCMCHSTENLYQYEASAIARASDDFYPREPESWLWHLTACAYNSLLLGQVALPDYDMFQTAHPASWFHAAARANSGGPVTVSDAPGAHDADVLRALALPDGSTLVATAQARVAADCVFADVSRDGETALKLVAPNGDDAAVVGVYNVQGSYWCRAERRFALGDNATVVARVAPEDADVAVASTSRRDVSDDETVVAYAFRDKRLQVLKRHKDASDPVVLRPGDFELFALRRVETTPSGVDFAPIGLLDMLNAGGAVGRLQTTPAGFAVDIRGPGTCGVYATKKPITLKLDGDPADFAYDQSTKLITLHIDAAARLLEIDFGP